MEFTTEIFEHREGHGLYVEVTGEEVTIDGLNVYEYYYEDDSTLLLKSRHDEIQIDTEENEIVEHLGDSGIRISLPEALVSDIEQLVTGYINEWTPDTKSNRPAQSTERQSHRS